MIRWLLSLFRRKPAPAKPSDPFVTLDEVLSRLAAHDQKQGRP